MAVSEQIKALQTDVFSQLYEHGHEQVMYCSDPELGLKAIIAIHNTTLGPALGGVRFWPYSSTQDALFDVLRLSRGMTLKAAAAGLNLGGGKAVLIGDPKKLRSEAFFRRFGMFVNNLGGKYITAEDVGVTVKDMEYIRMETPYVTGLPMSMGGSGDPSPVTAYGVYLGMKAAIHYLEGKDSLDGKTIVVKGVGKVGYYLIQNLRKEDTTIFAYDINKENLQRVVEEFGVFALESEEQVFTQPADIFAPCALGADLNAHTIPLLKVKIVAGAANNQLLDETKDALLLQQRGILYVPDFVINAGGLINVATELEGYNKERAYEKAERIYDHCLEVFSIAEQEQISTHEAALRMASRRIHSIKAIHQYL